MPPSTPTTHHIDRRAFDLAEAISAGGEADDLFSTKQLAELTSVSCEFFELGRFNGYGPPAHKLSPRRVRYRRGEVAAWLNERARSYLGRRLAQKKRRRPSAAEHFSLEGGGDAR